MVRQPKSGLPAARQAGAHFRAWFIWRAVISKDGTIQDLKVISGHPLLIPSALEAVKQWVYQPTLLNGEPVEVVDSDRRELHVEPVESPGALAASRIVKYKFNSQERLNTMLLQLQVWSLYLLQESGSTG